MDDKYNDWIGRTVINSKTGREFIVRDITGYCMWLSGGQIIPIDAIPGHWELKGNQNEQQ